MRTLKGVPRGIMKRTRMLEWGSQLTSGRNGQFYFDLGQAGKLECLRTGGLITQKNFMKSERGTVKLSRFETQVTFFWSCPNRQ